MTNFNGYDNDLAQLHPENHNQRVYSQFLNFNVHGYSISVKPKMTSTIMLFIRLRTSLYV